MNADENILPGICLQTKEYGLDMAMIRSLGSDKDFGPLRHYIAAQLTDKLLADGAVGAVGAGWSSDVVALSPSFTTAKIPLVSHSATAASLSNISRYPFFARVCPPDSLQGVALVDLIRTLGIKRIGVVYCDDTYCMGLLNDLLANLNTDDTDLLFTTQINRRGVQSADTSQIVIQSVLKGVRQGCPDVVDGTAVLFLVHGIDLKRLLRIEGTLVSQLRASATLVGSESVGNGGSTIWEAHGELMNNIIGKIGFSFVLLSLCARFHFGTDLSTLSCCVCCVCAVALKSSEANSSTATALEESIPGAYIFIQCTLDTVVIGLYGLSHPVAYAV